MPGTPSPPGVDDLKPQLPRFLPAAFSAYHRRILQNTPFLVFCLLLVSLPLLAALFFTLLYLFSFSAGLAGSYPCRELFLLFPVFDPLFAQPRRIAEALFASALLGAGVSWFLRGAQAGFVGKVLSTLGRQWNIFSFLFIFSLLFATLGHIYIAFDTPSYSILGILPHSDANAHYLGYSKYFYELGMGDFALRRPLGAFMGAAIHWLAGYDASVALMVRCLLVTCAMWASCAAVNRFFGVWSAAACLSMEYYHIGKFVGVAMTESLGFFWGCCAVALWLEALHRKRLFWDLAAFAVTLLGLLTRMGSMLLLPALALYIFWRWRQLRPGRAWWKKPLLGLCLCIAAVLVLDAAFSGRGYGGSGQAGSNFAAVFASLTLGQENGKAHQVYARELAALKSPRERSHFLYAQGLKNILHSPGTFLTSLMAGELAFIKNLHFLLFYNWWVICLLSLLLLMRRASLFPRGPAFFWGAVWTGVFLSIPFISFAEPRRVNIFVYPLVACFFSLALAEPRRAAKAAHAHTAGAASRMTLVLAGALLLLMAGVAFFPQLLLSRETTAVRSHLAAMPALPPRTVLASARGTGFLVVPDGHATDTSVLSMPWSTFRKRYQALSPKADAHFFADLFSRLPFAVLNLPVLAPSGWGYADSYFIAPPKVLEQKSAALWDFSITRQFFDRHWDIRWNVVATATPVACK